jgi:hypothetical protein
LIPHTPIQSSDQAFGNLQKKTNIQPLQIDWFGGLRSEPTMGGAIGDFPGTACANTKHTPISDCARVGQ